MSALPTKVSLPSAPPVGMSRAEVAMVQAREKEHTAALAMAISTHGMEVAIDKVAAVNNISQAHAFALLSDPAIGEMISNLTNNERAHRVHRVERVVSSKAEAVVSSILGVIIDDAASDATEEGNERIKNYIPLLALMGVQAQPTKAPIETTPQAAVNIQFNTNNATQNEDKPWRRPGAQGMEGIPRVSKDGIVVIDSPPTTK
jgi:hypothetical protein